MSPAASSEQSVSTPSQSPLWTDLLQRVESQISGRRQVRGAGPSSLEGMGSALARAHSRVLVALESGLSSGRPPEVGERLWPPTACRRPPPGSDLHSGSGLVTAATCPSGPAREYLVDRRPAGREALTGRMQIQPPHSRTLLAGICHSLLVAALVALDPLAQRPHVVLGRTTCGRCARGSSA